MSGSISIEVPQFSNSAKGAQQHQGGHIMPKVMTTAKINFSNINKEVLSAMTELAKFTAIASDLDSKMTQAGNPQNLIVLTEGLRNVVKDEGLVGLLAKDLKRKFATPSPKLDTRSAKDAGVSLWEKVTHFANTVGFSDEDKRMSLTQKIFRLQYALEHKFAPEAVKATQEVVDDFISQVIPSEKARIQLAENTRLDYIILNFLYGLKQDDVRDNNRANRKQRTPKGNDTNNVDSFLDSLS